MTAGTIPNGDLAEGALSKFPISKKLIKRLNARGITELFPVQYKTFDKIFSGTDAVVLSRTGTGKTLAFSLPIVEKLLSDRSKSVRQKSPLVIVLAPTRELVVQIATDFESLCAEDFAVLSVYGGVPLGPQCNALRRGVDMVIGTPGRVIDLIQRGVLNIDTVRHVVLDEVDRMLDMGFHKDVETIISSLYATESKNSSKPQTLLFSATLPAWVESVSSQYLSEDVYNISLIDDQEAQTSVNVEHLALPCAYEDRASTLADIIRVYSRRPESRCIVFCERKKDADDLAANNEMSSNCHVFHGDVPQDKREIVLKKFREGIYRVLLTTNVAARGLDVPEIDLVVQCQPPRDVEDYIHRSGRTGRAQRSGVSIVFYTSRERYKINQIEQRAGITFKHINAPTLSTIIDSAKEDLVKSITSISQAIWSEFIPTAQSLVNSLMETENPNPISYEDEAKPCKRTIKKKNMDQESSFAMEHLDSNPILLRAMCCLLARLSGKDGKVEKRSLLTSRKKFTTYRLDTEHTTNFKGTAYKILREHLPEDITESVKNLTFIIDRSGFLFDLPSDFDKMIAKTWPEDATNGKLTIPETLPQMEVDQFPQQDNFRGGGGGGRNSLSFSRGKRGFSDRGRGGYGFANKRGRFNGGGGGQRTVFNE